MNHHPSDPNPFTRIPRTLTLLSALALALTGSAGAEKQPSGIPFSQIGTKATADYHGDALAITATAEGARLKCGFQKLEGRATPEGLWLESSAAGGGTFRVVAAAVGRSSSRGRPNRRGVFDGAKRERGRTPMQVGLGEAY